MSTTTTTTTARRSGSRRAAGASAAVPLFITTRKGVAFITALCLASCVWWAVPSVVCYWGSGGDSNRVPSRLSSSSYDRRSSSRSKWRCSCFNPKASRTCCRRELLVEHKSGTFLVRSIFHPTAASTGIRLVARVDENSIPTEPLPSSPMAGKGGTIDVDYRHVITTRNWYDAFISGYLYHKSGREVRR